MVRKLLLLPLVVLTLGFAVVHLWPTAHSAPMPSCVHEDGAGQAVCYWDADTQGNGMGNDVVSGECVYEIALCMRVYERNSDGLDIIRMCNELEDEALSNVNARIARQNEGWTIAECFKAHL